MKKSVNKKENLNNDIDLDSYILSLLKYWFVFLISILLFASLFGIRAKQGTTVSYYASTEVYVKRSITENGKSVLIENSITSGLTNDFVDILNSEIVVKKAVENLNLDMSVRAAMSKVKVQKNEKNQVINLYVNSNDLNLSTSLANEITKLGVEEMNSMYGEITEVLKTADYAVENINGNPIVNESVKGAIVGLMLPFVIFSILYVFKNKFRKVDEVERILDLPVICVVANVKNRGKK